MKNLLLSLLFLIAIVFALEGQSTKDTGWKIVPHRDKKQVDVFYKGRLMTSYCYYDSIMKPVLYPINSASGVTVTRGYPLAPREGDHVDHPHHIGLWMNYESVNGFDFWNNSTNIPFDKRKLYGTIVHKKILSSEATDRRAKLETLSDWTIRDGTVLLQEKTTYTFTETPDQFVIDRMGILIAGDMEVYFKDVKDGFLGIRIATELEQPVKEPLEFLDVHGNLTRVEASEKKPTGLYISSENLKGDSVWGTRGRWTTLQGIKDGHPISITIIDHPSNAGYPTYWHARGYGLFSANPLGQEIFSKGKEKLDFKIPAHKSATFRYRIIISDSHPDPGEIDKRADEFARLR